MVDRLTDDDARRAILQGGSEALWQIACALDRTGANLAPAVSADRAVDLLNIAETENWPRSSRKNPPPEGLFQPMCVLPKEDGKLYRSLLPDDLSEADEAAIRDFAALAQHAQVRAHIYEILWARFKRYTDAVAAIDARLEAAKSGNANADWPALVRNLGRLTTLVLTLNARDKVAAVIDALEDGRTKLLTCDRKFAYPVLADMLCGTVLARREGRELFTPARATLWEEDLRAIARAFRNDPHHGHDALLVLREWVSRWHDATRTREVEREIVAQLQGCAAASDRGIAPTHREKALQYALDYGLADLTHTTRRELMESIKAAIPTFKEVSGRFDLPAELVAELQAIADQAPDAAAAVRRLSLLPGLLEVDREQITQSTREQLKDMPLLGVLPSVQFHPDGKITHRSEGGDANVEQHVARGIGMHLLLVEGLLRYFLGTIVSTIGPRTMLDALGAWPHLPATRQTILAYAAERFAAHDWVGSGYVAATQFEAVLRDLLRAGGYHALKAERDGAMMDETLNSLLRCEAAQQVLGTGFCSLAEFVLCDSALGWNLRNEIAHGTVRAEALSPARVLLLWLLIVRLTCFSVMVESGESAEGGSEGGVPEADS